ncbi:hypothetical protein Tco_0164258 [Tanacetum coccineum]
MDNTRAQQKALDDELVAPSDRLKIGKSNLRLSSILKSKEPTLQVALDALKLTPFYNAFAISADVPEIYMQEFWVTVSKHHSSLRFKLNGKSHTVNIDNFRDMFKIYPKLPSQIFEEPPLEEEILSFIKDLGYTGEIKFLSDVNVNHMHQPWRSFAATINKCLSGKTTALEMLSEVALTEAEQIKLATKRSLIQTHSSHASGSGTDEGTGSIPWVPDVPTYESDDEQISWKSSKEDNDDEVNVSEDNDDDADNDDDVDKDNEDDDVDNQDDENPDDVNQDDDDEQTDSDNDGDDSSS